MENQRVHEYSTEVGPNGLPQARLTKTHNLITFIKSGAEKVHYLDGRWVDDGGNDVDESVIPDDLKVQAHAIPFKQAGFRDADVLVNCEFCAYTGPSREYAEHLAEKHIKAARSTGADSPLPGLGQVVDPAADERPVRLKPEELPPGNYVTDEDGFVVINADGTPRKKAGRPRSE